MASLYEIKTGRLDQSCGGRTSLASHETFWSHLLEKIHQLKSFPISFSFAWNTFRGLMVCCWTNLRTQEPMQAADVMESAAASCMAIMMMYVNEQDVRKWSSSQEKENSIPKWCTANERGLSPQQWMEGEGKKADPLDGCVVLEVGVTGSCSGLPTVPKIALPGCNSLQLIWTVLVTEIESLWLRRPKRPSQ